ncbi:hypothetical protein IID26_00895, partial [Patescibacteria group bacterium]|nr:hypothetical protein [Patescibacteria group bacterium]
MHWTTKSIIAMFLLVPFFLLIPTLSKHFGLRSETGMLMWFFGTVVGIVVWSLYTNQLEILSIKAPALLVLLMGIVFGAAANILLGQSMVVAPNPGFPIAIISGNIAIIIILAPILAYFIPQFFDVEKITFLRGAGV